MKSFSSLGWTSVKPSSWTDIASTRISGGLEGGLTSRGGEGGEGSGGVGGDAGGNAAGGVGGVGGVGGDGGASMPSTFFHR